MASTQSTLFEKNQQAIDTGDSNQRELRSILDQFVVGSGRAESEGHVRHAGGQFVGIDVIVFGRVARVEAGEQFLVFLQIRSVPALVGRVLAEIVDDLTSQRVALPLKAHDYNDFS